MNFKRILIISLILFLVSLTVVSATDINDIDINESSGGNDSLKSSFENILLEETYTYTPPGTFADLQAEINNAPAGSVLTLNRSYNDFGSIIQLNKNLTIDGQGNTLDCLNTKIGAFYSSSGNIVLKNLIIKNGHNDDNYMGGAICIEGSAQYTIENCIFKNNWADDYGGAIYNGVDKPLTIINSRFENNTADDYNGGAIYSKGDLYINGSSFYGNKAVTDALVLTTGVGGAVFCEKNVNVTNSCFTANYAFYGGALYTTGYIDAVNTKFYQNNAKTCGGAVFTKNYINVRDCIFEFNVAHNYGGAVYARIININNNLETAPFNTSFISNTAENDKGGALYATEYINAVNTEFSYNTANVDGGAAYAENNINVRHCLFESNQATGAKIISCYGGAIRSEETVIINNSTFNNNYATDYGGAVYAKIININNNVETAPFNTFFNHNVLKSNKGGALYATEYINAVNTVFSKNIAKVDGGAAYAKNNINVRHCLFEYNKASRAITASCYGGAICAEETAIINNSTFKNNYADNKGGAVYAKDVTLVDTPSFFEGNTARDCGGAIYTGKFNDDVFGASFINNDAYTGDGGAIYINYFNWITFANCIFANNKADDRGGAIYLDSDNSELTLKYNIFISNKANDEGQDIYNSGYYGVISENYWSTNPTKDNDQLVEYRWPESNIHHIDSNPLKMEIKLSENPCVVNTSIEGAAAFYKNNGDQCSGALYTDFIEFLPVADVEFANRTNYANSANIIITPTKEGTYKISANLFGEIVSEALEVNYDTSLLAPDSDGFNETPYGIAFIIENTENYKYNYQTDLIGLRGTDENYTYYSNEYTALANNLLGAVGTYFNDSDVNDELAISNTITIKD